MEEKRGRRSGGEEAVKEKRGEGEGEEREEKEWRGASLLPL